MSDTDVVRTITIKGMTEGVDPATDSVNKLRDAMAGVSVQSDTTSKSTLSVQSALDRQQRSLDVTYRSQLAYNQSVKVINQGLNEGLISQDRANQLTDLASQRFDKATSSATPFGAVLHGVQTQLVALAAGAGPVGVFLASFGPWGLAAAAGIGIVVNGFGALTNAADALAQKAQGLQTFSLITGLTADQIQKLEEEGSKFGIQTDTVGKFLDQFSVKLATAREASGTYYDLVRQINPALAQQVLATSGEAAQLVILAQAYAQAGEKGNALLEAASGRGGVQVAPLLGAIGAAGSVNNLSATPGLSQPEIAAMTKTFNDAAVAVDHYKTNVGAIAFNAGFLDSSKQMANDIERVTAAVRDFSPSQAWNDFVAGFARKIGAGSASAANFKPPAVPVIPVESGNLPAATGGQSGPDPVATANQYKALIGALGSAATAQEQYKLKIADADIARSKNILTESEYNRVIAAAGLDKKIQLEGMSISQLGALASVTALVTQKQDAINAANQKGAGITPTQTAGILAMTEAQASFSKLQTQSNLGVASFDVASAAQKELAANITAGIVPINQQTAALAALTKKYQDLSDASKVAGSSLPQLTQLGLDAGNLDKQLDTLTTGSLNNLTDGILSVTTNAKTMGQAFTNLSTQVVTAIEKMIIQMTIIQPLAAALKTSLGGGFNFSSLFGGSPAAPTNIIQPGTGGMSVPTFHTGGMIGVDGGSSRYVHPSYFENAPRFHSGGMAGDEMPIIAKRGEGVFTQGQMAAMGGGGNSAPSKIIINNYGADVQTQQHDDGTTELTVRAIARDEMGSSRTNGINKAKYGQSPQLRQRRG